MGDQLGIGESRVEEIQTNTHTDTHTHTLIKVKILSSTNRKYFK
jgi:hypothetical protein